MAEKSLDVEIVTPKEKVFKGEAESVSVPGLLSPFQILYNHAPIVSALEIGIVKIVDINNTTINFATTTGFVEVKDNKVSILVESAIGAEDIDINILNASIENLHVKIEGLENKSEKEELKILLKEAENQLKIAEK